MISVLYDKNRLYVFDLQETIEYGFYRDRDRDSSVLLSYCCDLINEMFRYDTGNKRLIEESITNGASKMHLYLYPQNIFSSYYTCFKEYNGDDTVLYNYIDCIHQSEDYLAKMIKEYRRYVMDKVNTKIRSKLKSYNRRKLRVIYHFNNQNFLKLDKEKNDSIFESKIFRTYPVTIEQFEVENVYPNNIKAEYINSPRSLKEGK